MSKESMTLKKEYEKFSKMPFEVESYCSFSKQLISVEDDEIAHSLKKTPVPVTQGQASL